MNSTLLKYGEVTLVLLLHGEGDASASQLHHILQDTLPCWMRSTGVQLRLW